MDVCENSAKCPIFSGMLQGKEFTQQAYRSKYCEAGEAGWELCKRYLTKAKYDACPPNLLPNSGMNLEAIAEKYALA